MEDNEGNTAAIAQIVNKTQLNKKDEEELSLIFVPENHKEITQIINIYIYQSLSVIRSQSDANPEDLNLVIKKHGL
jgi:hypothetical protein